MRQFIKTLIIMCFFIICIPATVRAETTKINDLIENAKDFDGQEVMIQGEAIGENMIRNSYAWININDISNSIGVWLSSDEVNEIKYYGNYMHIGDTVKITGTFYRACKEHGGEADLHAITFEVVESGHPVNITISIPKIIAAAILLVVALFLYFVVRRMKANRK